MTIRRLVAGYALLAFEVLLCLRFAFAPWLEF